VRRLATASAALAFGLALVLAPTAGSSPSLRVGIFDDGVVLYGEPDAVFGQLAKTGTQLLRVNLWWAGPGIRVATSRPRRPGDPNDPAYNWDTYDRTVRFAIVNGIQPVFSIIGTPPWANAAKGWNVAPTNPRDLRLFASAAQKRYSGDFVNADGITLPRVSLWMAWNEPNNPVFLKPQYRRVGSTWMIQSGRDYAKICNAVVQGIKLIQRSSKVACGATGPRGNNNPNASRPSVAPVPFLRAMKAGGAKGFDAYAHHPYYGSPAETPSTKPPPGRRGQPPTAVTLGNLDILVNEIDKLYGRRMRLWITEYGYQTKPPDGIFGVTYSKQSTYLTQAVAIARRHPRVDMFLWFLLRDEVRLGGWQSGLTTNQGTRKPSFNAFRRAALAASGSP
jgi:Glycosyl hydrolase catalytic core